MALIQFDFTPETVKVCLPVYMIVPDPVRMGDVPVSERKVLYLLHGLSDNGSAWQRYTTIETLAREYGLVVVMPSISRSFYTDQPNGQLYFTYLMEELPRYLKGVFGLDPKPEDTLIAGNSMGGFGAFKAALNYPERFYAAASFSGALSLAILGMIPDDPRQKEFSMIFGDLTQLEGTQHDSMVWLQKAAEHPENLPKLYMACGKQDDLYPLNQMFFDAAQRMDVPVQYESEDGKHNWPFWEKYIQRFLAWALGEPEG
jgi:S-formylglutathione hydrolase FrmB